MTDMTKADDSGPAFPVIAENGLGHVSDGMSLRDWFAGQVLPAVMADAMCRGTIASIQDVVRKSYSVANAMLAERIGNHHVPTHDSSGTENIDSTSDRR